MYTLRFATYSGMSYPLSDPTDRADARAEAAHRIMRARAMDRPVTIVKRGLEWEFETPEDASMIGDYDGLLWIDREAFECRECGSEYDDRDSANSCCTEDDC